MFPRVNHEYSCLRLVAEALNFTHDWVFLVSGQNYCMYNIQAYAQIQLDIVSQLTAFHQSQASESVGHVA